MCNILIMVSAHTSLNSSKGVIRSRDLEGVTEDEMLNNLSSQGVSAVKRIHIRRNNELVPTNTFILTFCKPLLPDSIKVGYLKIPVVPFIPNPLQCFKCHLYGHGENACRGKVTCARCGQDDHESKTCTNAISCANCKGSHFAYSRECPKWKQEKQVQHVRVEKQVAFPEARRLVETRSGAVAETSYATAVKVSTTNASVQNDLTWPNGADRFIKISDIQKTRKQATKAAQKQQTSVASHVSLDSLNQQEACTSGQPRQSKPVSKETNSYQRSVSLNRKKPETDVCSGRLKKAEQHIIPISNSYNTLADLGDDGMDICQEGFLRNKKPAAKAKINPILPLDD